jgi:hypothetical protein
MSAVVKALFIVTPNVRVERAEYGPDGAPQAR